MYVIVKNIRGSYKLRMILVFKNMNKIVFVLMVSIFLGIFVEKIKK